MNETPGSKELRHPHPNAAPTAGVVRTEARTVSPRVALQAPPADSRSGRLPNGDPPPLMLWGDEK